MQLPNLAGLIFSSALLFLLPSYVVAQTEGRAIYPETCRVSNRTLFAPGDRNMYIGFRLAQS